MRLQIESALGLWGYLSTFLENYHINNSPIIRLCMHPSIYPPTCPSTHLSLFPSIHRSSHPSIYPSILSSTHPSTYPPIHLFTFSTWRKHLPCASPVLSAVGDTKMKKTWFLPPDLQIQTVTRNRKAKWTRNGVIREVIEGLWRTLTA